MKGRNTLASLCLWPLLLLQGLHWPGQYGARAQGDLGNVVPTARLALSGQGRAGAVVEGHAIHPTWNSAGSPGII